MKRKITFTAFALLVSLFTAYAGNNYVNKVIIANEGHYDYISQVQTVPVTLGAYDPTTQVYTSLDTIWNARFASHVVVDGANIYVAADSFLIRYDANTYQRLGTAILPGVRKVAVWNNQLLVSRGEYGMTFNSYFLVYDKISMGFLYELPSTAGPQYASEGIVIKNDTAYIAVNNGYEWGYEVGLVGRIDLAAQTYLNEIDLGPIGKNPEAIFLDNGTIYTVNNNSYDTASVSSIDIASQVVGTTSLMLSTGCGASDYYKGNVMFQVSMDDQLQRFSTSSQSVTDVLAINKSIYGMATDTINNLMYLGETDYVSTGMISIFDLTGNLQSTFNVGVAPGNIALDVREVTGINENNNASHALVCYPNPAQKELRVMSYGLWVSEEKATLDIYNIVGVKVNSSELTTRNSQLETTVDVSALAKGVYFVQSSSNPSERVKFVKQ